LKKNQKHGKFSVFTNMFDGATGTTFRPPNRQEQKKANNNPIFL